MDTKTKVLITGLVIFGIAVFGYLKATESVDVQNGNLPKIEIAPKSFDFGEVEFGKIPQYIFKVKNSGEGILEIKTVATSCACTTAQISKEKINPNEEAELLVSYDTAAMGKSSHGTGRQERIIYVKSNDPINPLITVMIYAYVK